MNIVQLEDVGLTYFSKNGETNALKSITMNIKEGEFVSIVGPSGCGKTTILSLMSGLLKPTKGKVSIGGKSPEENREMTGYMFQKDLLFEWRTILKNIYLGLEIKNKKTIENKKYANELLEKYGLSEFLSKYPNQLSGGMRQRVALIRTLVLKPEVLLLDEPFSALDYQTRINVCDDVSKILKSEKKTTVLVTHDISEAISLSDRVIVLTNRPATIKKEYNIEFDCETPREKRESPKFNEYFKQIWRDLQNENQK